MPNFNKRYYCLNCQDMLNVDVFTSGNFGVSVCISCSSHNKIFDQIDSNSVVIATVETCLTDMEYYTCITYNIDNTETYLCNQDVSTDKEVTVPVNNRNDFIKKMKFLKNIK